MTHNLFILNLELQPVFPQTQPTHLYLRACSTYSLKGVSQGNCPLVLLLNLGNNVEERRGLRAKLCGAPEAEFELVCSKIWETVGLNPAAGQLGVATTSPIP